MQLLTAVYWPLTSAAGPALSAVTSRQAACSAVRCVLSPVHLSEASQLHEHTQMGDPGRAMQADCQSLSTELLPNSMTLPPVASGLVTSSSPTVLTHAE